jgi:hypothetical protein
MGDFQRDTLASVIKRLHAVQIAGLFKNLIWTILISDTGRLATFSRVDIRPFYARGTHIFWN